MAKTAFKKLIKVASVTCLVALLCCGCGSEEEVDFVATGMSQIESLDYSSALSSFEAALAAGEDARLTYRGMGIAHMGMGDYADAVADLEQALKLSSGIPEDIDYDINYYLAVAYYKNGQITEALDRYTAIIALKPEEADAYYLRGCVYMYQGNFDMAMADFDKNIELAPEDYDRLISIYEVLDDNGYKEAGAELLSKVLNNREKQMSRYDLGRIYYYLEDYTSAKSYLSDLNTSEDAEAALYLGRTHEALGDYNYASTIYSDFIQNNQTNPEIYNQLGLCRLKMGEYEQALLSFQAGMNIEENNMLQTLKFNEIVAYEYMEDYQTAAVLMNDYLKSYPDDTQAKREYKFLKTR